jgi:hypothetical protein
MISKNLPSKGKQDLKRRWLRVVFVEVPLLGFVSLMFCIICPGLHFRIAAGKFSLSRSTRGNEYRFSLNMMDWHAIYESGSGLAEDDGMWCGEFPTGAGWIWRKGVAYAGMSRRGFIGWHQ